MPVFFTRRRHARQGEHASIHGDDGTQFNCSIDFLKVLEDDISFERSNCRQCNHTAPDQTVIPALEQLQIIFSIVCDQRWVNIANFIQHLDTIGLDIFVLVPQVFGNLADALAIFLLRKFPGKFLVGDFVATILEMSNSVEDRHINLLKQPL